MTSAQTHLSNTLAYMHALNADWKVLQQLSFNEVLLTFYTLGSIRRHTVKNYFKFCTYSEERPDWTHTRGTRMSSPRRTHSRSVSHEQAQRGARWTQAATAVTNHGSHLSCSFPSTAKLRCCYSCRICTSFSLRIRIWPWEEQGNHNTSLSLSIQLEQSYCTELKAETTVNSNNIVCEMWKQVRGEQRYI